MSLVDNNATKQIEEPTSCTTRSAQRIPSTYNPIAVLGASCAKPLFSGEGCLLLSCSAAHSPNHLVESHHLRQPFGRSVCNVFTLSSRGFTIPRHGLGFKQSSQSIMLVVDCFNPSQSSPSPAYPCQSQHSHTWQLPSSSRISPSITSSRRRIAQPLEIALSGTSQWRTMVSSAFANVRKYICCSFGGSNHGEDGSNGSYSSRGHRVQVSLPDLLEEDRSEIPISGRMFPVKRPWRDSQQWFRACALLRSNTIWGFLAVFRQSSTTGVWSRWIQADLRSQVPPPLNFHNPPVGNGCSNACCGFPLELSKCWLASRHYTLMRSSKNTESLK